MANSILAMIGALTLGLLGVAAVTSLIVLGIQGGRAFAHWLTNSKPVG